MDFIEKAIEKSLEKKPETQDELSVEEQEKIENKKNEIEKLREELERLRDNRNILVGEKMAASKKEKRGITKQIKDVKRSITQTENAINVLREEIGEEQVSEVIESEIESEKGEDSEVEEKPKEQLIAVEKRGDEKKEKQQIPDLIKEAIAVAEKRQGELENDMYKQLCEILREEYKETKDKEEYIKETRIDLDMLNIKSVSQDDKKLLDRFGFDEADGKNKKELLKLYKNAGRRVLDELKEIEEIGIKAQKEAEVVKSEIEKTEMKWNDLEDFLKRDVELLRKDYNKPFIKESVIVLVKENMEKYTVNEEYMKNFLENVSHIKFTDESKKRLSDLALNLYGDLLAELGVEQEKPETEIEPEMPETSEIKTEEARGREAKNLEYKKTAEKSSDEMRHRVTETGEKIASDPEMSDENKEKLKEKMSMETVSSVMFDLNRDSYEEDPEKRRKMFEAAASAMKVALLEQKTICERKKSELTEARKEAVEKFGIASEGEIERVISKPEKKNIFNRLKEKIGGISGKKEVGKIEEINEEISNVTKLEDLAKVADFIEEKYGIKFKHSFKKSLEDEKSEILRGNYNSAVEVVNSSEEGSQKDALIKFYEKLDELLKEIEGEESPVDIIGDISPVEEIEPIKLTPETPEIETLDSKEISEEMKWKIKVRITLMNDNEFKEFGKIIKDNHDSLVESDKNIKELFGITGSFAGMFGNMFDVLKIRFEEVEDIKTKDFMETVEKIYDEVKEKESETGEITEDMNREDIEKEINAFLEKDELNIANVKSLEDLKNLLGSLEMEIKDISKKKIPNELTYGLRIIESKIEYNHFMYCLEGEELLVDPADIEKNFSKDRNIAKGFEIDSLKEYYLELLDKVEELYDAEKEKLENKKEKTGEITEEMKESIRKKLVRMKEELTDFNENIEGFINRFSNSKKLFGEEFSELWFNTFFKGDASIKFKEIKNIKIKDFMAVLKKIYDEIEKEK